MVFLLPPARPLPHKCRQNLLKLGPFNIIHWGWAFGLKSKVSKLISLNETLVQFLHSTCFISSNLASFPHSHQNIYWARLTCITAKSRQLWWRLQTLSMSGPETEITNHTFRNIALMMFISLLTTPFHHQIAQISSRRNINQEKQIEQIKRFERECVGTSTVSPWINWIFLSTYL